MHVVVTGSQSFIGRRFIELARSRGITVTGVDRIAGGPNDVVMDVRDPGLAEAIPLGADAIVHLAAISRDADCRDNPLEAFDVNVRGTLNVAKAARERGIRQLIFASTEWVYGEVSGGGAQTEDQAIDVNRIDSEYALSKIVGERVLSMAHRRGLENVTVLRFGIVYGPRPVNRSAPETLFHQVGSEASVTVGSLASARRFIHLDDIGTGIIAALGRTGYEVFNLSGDRLITLQDWIEASGRVHGTNPQVTQNNPGAVSVRNADNAKAVAQLGWRPGIELEAGLASLREAVVPSIS